MKALRRVMWRNKVNMKVCWSNGILYEAVLPKWTVGHFQVHNCTFIANAPVLIQWVTLFRSMIFIFCRYTHLSPCKHIQIKGKCLTCKMLENDDRESYRRGTYMFVVNITNSRRPEAGVSSRFYFNTDELGTWSF